MSCIEVEAVPKRNPRPAQYVAVEPIDGRQGEVSVKWIGFETLHDGEDRHAVPPDIAGDVEDLASTDPASVQVDRGRRGKVVEVCVGGLPGGNLAHVQRLLVGDQTKRFSYESALPTTESIGLEVVHLHREVPRHRDLLNMRSSF